MVKKEQMEYIGKIGSFRLNDTKRGFVRYIAHKDMRDIVEASAEISAWAEQNGYVSSILLQTLDCMYPTEKRCEIYIVNPEHAQYICDFEEKNEGGGFASKISLSGFNPEEFSLVIGQRRPHYQRNSKVIDINKELKSEHTNIVQALESILKEIETN